MKKKFIWFFIALLSLNCLTIFIIKDTVAAQDGSVYEIISTSQNVKVELNGDLLNFDVSPIITDNRTLVPFRKILETLGAEVSWDNNSRTVTTKREDLTISLQIDNKSAFLNEKEIQLDVAPIIVNGRTLIPVRFISEKLGYKVDWDSNIRTVIISTADDNINTHKEFNLRGISIGDSEEKVIKALGEPARKDLSKYGFRWYIYNNDYSKYIQVGIKDNKVVGLYTNADGWKSKKGITIGTSKAEVNSKYDNVLSGIRKGNTIYNLDDFGSDTFLVDDYYITIFYDIYNENSVTAVLLIEKETEQELNSFFSEPSDELRRSYERQVFDLANAVRARFNKSYFVWDDNVAEVAREHSKDMALKNYFSHTNPDGKSPFNRMENKNIDFKMAAENIAGGQTSAIFAHEGLMNSKGHRKNILGDCKKLGVGVYFGGSYNIYYTQNFYTPMN